MAAELGQVFVSFLANKGVARQSCQKILDHFKPIQRADPEFKVWHRDLIRPGSNRDLETTSALDRCKVAVVLVSSEYLASEYWQTEAKPLLAAAREQKICLLWQPISPCNWEQEEIKDYQPMIPGSVLSSLNPAQRGKDEVQISNIVYEAWQKESRPLSHGIGRMDMPVVPKSATKATPCHAVALVVAPSGGDQGGLLCYRWQAWVQKSSEKEYQEIPNGVLGAGAVFKKDQLPMLLQLLHSWMGRELNDVAVLEIFVSDDLLEEDWGSMSIMALEDRALHDYQPYLLRSLTRLIHPEWHGRREGPLKRMHGHLVEGTGVWMPDVDLTNLKKLRTLDGYSYVPQRGADVVTAICCPQAMMLPNRSSWLKSVLESMAPLVVWPSRQNALAEEQLKSCLGKLQLTRNDATQAGKVGRPHCPDLAQLAMARMKCHDPTPDLKGITILVEHPERRPDPKILQQTLVSTRLPEGEQPEPLAAPLISP